MQNRRRLSLDITDEQADALYRHLEWGEKNRLFSLLIDDLIAAFERYGAPRIIGALKARELGMLDLVKLPGVNYPREKQDEHK